MTLWIALSVSSIVFVWLAWRLRGITFMNAHRLDAEGRLGMTDQERQVRAASQWNGVSWPSTMHQISGSKGRMKDVGMILTAYFQKLLKDKESVYPLTIVCHLGTVASAVMLYFVAALYWNETIALFLFFLYLGCFWPHQITLSGGYHTLSQFFFLLSIFALQKNAYAASGAALALMMFSSPATRKLLPLYLAAFFWNFRPIFQPSPPDFFGAVGLVTLWGMGIFLLYWGYAPMMTAIYQGRAPAAFNRLLVSRSKYPLDRYLALRGKIFSAAAKITGAFVGYTIFCRSSTRESVFLHAHLSLVLGVAAVVFLLTAPKVLQNLRDYFSYWYSPQNSNHFLFYKEFFRKIGRPITNKMRGAGLRWLIPFFFKNTPFHTVLFLAASCFLLAALPWGKALGWIALGLSPILYGEWTRSPQFSRPYFPALLGLLLVPALALNEAAAILPAPVFSALWVVLWVFAAGTLLWNFWIFGSDLLPARMAPTALGKILQQRGTKILYTYESPYNDHFVGALKQNSVDLEVREISSLSEVQEGLIAVPGTSCKALNIESFPEGIGGRDFNADPGLTQLIESKKISGAAVASFQTFGTSKIWALDSEVPSYRSLILKDITDSDRWRGRAWLLDAKKLPERSGDATRME